MHKFKKHDLPVWASWLAQDADGSWWVFEHEPHLADRSWYENEVGRVQKVGVDDVSGGWRESLEKIFQ